MSTKCWSGDGRQIATDVRVWEDSPDGNLLGLLGKVASQGGTGVVVTARKRGTSAVGGSPTYLKQRSAT
jgi:hypothetical protein